MLQGQEEQQKGEPVGQRIVVSGRVLDEAGRPVPNTVVEIWQANAAGRYIHKRDQHPAPAADPAAQRGNVPGHEALESLARRALLAAGEPEAAREARDRAVQP